MGIKGLWNVITPFSEKKSLHEIRGETLAVDLSGWVCDSQNVTDYYIQPKMYLRNLFFRTVYLLLADIKPIFVLEGDAPELKRDVMTARNAIQFRGAAPRAGNSKGKEANVSRKRFKGVLTECENLLKTMGVLCVKGEGEAEATCARLNAKGLVDAVISQDSDCFAYGARRVYRNFSVSSAGGGGALQGSIDCYDADLMFKKNGFGRKKMVALALLCGCDYGVGACGSSINTVVSFLHTVPEEDIVLRLLSWVSEPDKYEKLARWLATPGVCDRCGHAGRTHNKNGCPVCVTHRTCHDYGHKVKVSEVKREVSLRKRALSSGMPFPESKVMKEFLDTTPEDIDIEAVKMPTPSLIQFVKIMSHKLDWSEKYCVEKFLPLLTKWHLQDHVPVRTIKPIAIKKKRNPRGVPSFEVLWEDIDGLYEALIPDDQFEEDEDVFRVWTSIERQDLMRKYYPGVVEAYEDSIKKPPKVKKTRKKKEMTGDVNKEPKKTKRKVNKKKQDKDITELSKSLGNISISKVVDVSINKSQVSVSVNKLKRKIKNNNSKCKNTIESYLKPKKRRSSKMKSFNYSVMNISIDKQRAHLFEDFDKVNISSDRIGFSILNASQVEESEGDISDIIDKITSRETAATTTKVNDAYVKLVFNKNNKMRKSILTKRFNQNCSTPNQSPAKHMSIGAVGEQSVNTSYFYDKLTDQCDAFEMSLDYKNRSILNISDATIDYSLPDVCL